MAVRHIGGARLRRLARGRPRLAFAALACLLYAFAGVTATWPAVLHVRADFLSGGAPGHGEASPGDHLQTLYHWWLVGHQLEHGHVPWLDPYSFRPEASAQPNYPGWPFGFLFWPLNAAFGSVVAWNLSQLAIYLLAGLFTYLWLRELGLPRAAALTGGLAFAIAPYRVQQSVGHLLGPISILLPLSLWAVERARRGSAWWLVLSGAALASIPLSGQVHLALGAIPFFLAYALIRLPRNRLFLGGIAACVAAAVGAGIVVRQTVIVGSTQAGGRSLHEVSVYSARWGDFLARHVDHARSEQFVYLGWATPLLALAGLVVLVRARRFALATLLALGTAIPALLALGTHVPLYSALWHALPPFHFPRVPERLLPIAALCLAALVAFAVGRVRTRAALVSLLVVVLLFVDLHVRAYGKSVPDSNNAAYAALRNAPPGRLLELPIFDPGVHYGSVYLWYDTNALRQRPGGYSTTAPTDAKTLADRLQRLNCGDWSAHTAGLLSDLGVHAIALHLGLYFRNSAVPERTYFAWRGLLAHGWSTVATSDVVWLLTHSRVGLQPAIPEPPRNRPAFCQGWYGETEAGRYMSETHAPLWIYGSGQLHLHFAPSPLARAFTVDGRTQGGPNLALGKRGWHVITVQVPHLVTVNGKTVGLALRALSTSPSSGSRSRHTGSSP
jgi:hypothetical protein